MRISFGLAALLAAQCVAFLAITQLSLKSVIPGFVWHEETNQHTTTHNHAAKPSYFVKNMSTIRRWGCDRTETPFIFVHIGKAGGGSVRARIAASSLNYTKRKFHLIDGSYYPISNTSRAYFCNSCFSNRRPSTERSFEGTTPCHATTPIGQAIACPESMRRYSRETAKRQGECHAQSDTCRLVYAGHNLLGSEMNWLPGPYLSKWWSSLSVGHIALPWERLDPDEIWCPAHNASRPYTSQDTLKLYENCSIPMGREVDAMVHRAVSPENGVVTSWAPLYASLPVLRVVVVREPFSWLISKYFWHKQNDTNATTCDNEEHLFSDQNFPRRQEYQTYNSDPGWLTRMATLYILFLCGQDCVTRYATGRANLLDLELQAAENLRHSFAVVGLLEELDTFYDMLDTRVKYMNTSLNPNVTGGKHSSVGNKERSEVDRCKERFKDPKFQAKLLSKSPELRALKRLHQVAVEVNRFQITELNQCKQERGKVP